jgi:hypothetical protein
VRLFFFLLHDDVPPLLFAIKQGSFIGPPNNNNNNNACRFLLFFFWLLVRFCRHGMALLRVHRRDDGPQILRAVLTILSSNHKDVISMHGSLRTARAGAIRCLRRVFRQRIDVRTTSITKEGQPAAAAAAVDNQNRANNNNNRNTKETVALLCRQMDEAVTAILELPY